MGEQRTEEKLHASASGMAHDCCCCCARSVTSGSCQQSAYSGCVTLTYCRRHSPLEVLDELALEHAHTCGERTAAQLLEHAAQRAAVVAVGDGVGRRQDAGA